MDQTLQLSVSDFVAIFNQTISYAYPQVTITGELANFRVSKNRWVYFDLKDEQAQVRFFGTIYQLPGPLEDGMLLAVTGTPQLHPQFGFSVTISQIQLTGEGTIKKAQALLQAKLDHEGLFDAARKRALPYPPQRLGLITSGESAAYADFIKVLQARWRGVVIEHYDVQVQGEAAPGQIIAAIEHFNGSAQPPEVLVITRGGGSAEDLAAFSTEQVTRGVASSRIPTLVAIGHEIDVSLAELAADRRASTPSNAAELLVPDRVELKAQLSNLRQQLTAAAQRRITVEREVYKQLTEDMAIHLARRMSEERRQLRYYTQLLNLADPRQLLKRGYALVRKQGQLVRSATALQPNDALVIEFHDGQVQTAVNKVQ